MFRFTTHLLTKARNVSSRYISHEPLSLSKGSYRERFPPLIQGGPGLHAPTSLSNSQIIYPTKITTLPNGLRIASEDTPGPATCIGIYVDSGSIYEAKGESGISHLLERLAYKDTKNRAHMQIVQEVEGMGANVAASASREQMGYSFDTLKAYLPQAIELLVDCVRNPIFLQNEVQEQLEKVKEDVEEMTKDPQKYLLESLHLTGFTGPLSNPLMIPHENFDNINASLVEKFYFENYTADKIVLSASGVDHEFLLQIAEPLLCDLQAGPVFNAPPPKSAYIGGDVRLKTDSDLTHVALAFETPGGWRQDKDASVLTVLQTLMGGGGSFSSGGPGKGMHSRLYLRVLNRYHEVQAFSAFSSLFNDTGLFGITSTTPSSFAGKAVEIAIGELISIATPGEVSELELDRAKNATKSAILTNLESRAIVAEDIGRQILTYGERKPVDYFMECIDEMRVEDITYMAQSILSTPLTLSCWGNVDLVPSYSSINRVFHA